MGLDRVAVAAQELLDAAADSLTEWGLVVPDRVLRTHGEPAWDCEMLSAHVAALRPLPAYDTAAGPRHKCSVVPGVDLVLHLVRCAPVAKPLPTADVLDDFAASFMADQWALWRGLIGRWKDATLFDGLPCAEVTVGAMLPTGPSGAYAGLRWPFTVQLVPNAADDNPGGS